MIKIEIKEFLEGDYAIYEKVVTFFGHSIYQVKHKTANIEVVNQFKNNTFKVRGFNDENSN